MKLFPKIVSAFALLLMLSGLGTSSKACDRTDVTLDSVVVSGSNFIIYETVCIGAGVTGTTNGADSDTRDIAFGFYNSSGPINVLAFTPASIVGDTTACPLVGANAGPQGPPFNSQGTIGYLDPYYYYYPYIPCALGYLCISSTAACGEAHAQCTQYSFTVDAMPDSIRLFGAEGAGNPQGGCYPNPDMLIDFTSLPVVWAGFDAMQKDFGVQLDWTTVLEVNNDHFDILRSEDGIEYVKIGEVEALGESHAARKYSFFDRNPLKSQNHYLIRQVDKNGANSPSDVVTVEYLPPTGLTFTGFGPNPTDGNLDIHFLAEKAEMGGAVVYDLTGKKVIEQEFEAMIGRNTLDLDMTELRSGIYFFRVQIGQFTYEKKVLKN